MAKKPKIDAEETLQLILTQIQTIQIQLKLIQDELQRHGTLLEEHSKTLSSHTGTLAEILVNVKRLDEERLVEHHRLQTVIDEVARLEEAH